ncbi:hypothetical protein PEC311524_43240 [Pectobacterium carotovorum subsp. carotovorum]|nr:hypothetical protein PEC311524_43240 [Pectobacterium carotovorum subsp. carotovorum]
MDNSCEKLGWFTSPEQAGSSGLVNLGDIYGR